MLILASTSDIIRILNGAGTADIEVHASWVDYSTVSGAITPGRTNTASITSGSSTTTVVASPGASTTYRNVRHINIYNNHASQANTIAIEHTDGSTPSTLFECNLLAGETITFGEDGVWRHFDTSGGEYPSAVSPGDLQSVASRTQMEAGTSLVVAVTPGMMLYHPGMTKFWVEILGSGSAVASFNCSQIVDTSAGLGQAFMSFGLNVVLGITSWGYHITGERVNNTASVTNMKLFNIRVGGLFAYVATFECMDGTAVTPVQEDPANYYLSGWGTPVWSVGA